MELLGGDPSLTTVVVASALGGTASAFAIPTASPLVAGTVEPADRQRANALMGITANTSRLAGPALAGALIWAAGPGWAFILDGASFALSARCSRWCGSATCRCPAVPSSPTCGTASARYAPATGSGPACSGTACGTAPPPC